MSVHAPELHWVITYNHPKCLYCTNSLTMLSEWLRGTGIAGVANEPSRPGDYPGSGPGSDCHEAAQQGPATTPYNRRVRTALCNICDIKSGGILYPPCLMAMLIPEAGERKSLMFIPHEYLCPVELLPQQLWSQLDQSHSAT